MIKLFLYNKVIYFAKKKKYFSFLTIGNFRLLMHTVYVRSWLEGGPFIFGEEKTLELMEVAYGGR